MRQRQLISRNIPTMPANTHFQSGSMNRKAPRTCSNAELSGCTDVSLPQRTAQRLFHPWRWSEHFWLLLHSQTCPAVYNISLRLKCFWKCQASLSRWLTCWNNHYRWHTSCRAKQDVVIPPVRPARSKIYVTNAVEQETEVQFLTLVLFYLFQWP